MCFTVRTVCIYMWSMFMLPPISILSKSVTKSLTVRTVHGHVAGVYTAVHPKTCVKCDRKCYSKGSLQRHEANVLLLFILVHVHFVHDQLVVSRESVLENRRFEYKVANP